MIISLYGVSRCGKDFTIQEIVKKFNGELLHVKGSETLNKLSLEHYGNKFKLLSDEEQFQIRKLFVKYIKSLEKEYHNIIVDGHYSFPDGDKFKVVFTNEDYELYDAFFYLNKSSEFIRENCLKNDKKQYEGYLLELDNIDKWKDFEIKEMSSIFNKSNKDFIVLDNSLSNTVNFIYDFVTQDLRITNIVEKILQRYEKQIKNHQNIFLLDLDKTISYDDLTKDFIKNSSLDDKMPKKIFKGDYYTTYQFYRFHNELMNSNNYDPSIKYALEHISFNQELINELKHNDNYLMIGITTGMADAWKVINENINLFDILIGKGKYSDYFNTIVTPKLKGMLTITLRDMNKNVYAIGDSYIDLEMLKEANKGFLINMYKLDKRIIQLEDYLTKFNIFQLDYSSFKYEKIKEVETIW